MTSNQYRSRKQRLLGILHEARASLDMHKRWGEGARIVGVKHANTLLARFWRAWQRAPASTRRRWRAGQ